MAHPINPFYPIAEVHSVEELMDIASSMEVEAARRFEQLAGMMDGVGNSDTAALFRELARDEVAHENAIATWAAREGRRPPQAQPFQWRMPETFSLEDTAGGEYLTPYEALGVALENEERAFAFYTYLAAVADTEDARLRAEALAKGELDHVAQLRYRRMAMHQAPSRRRPAPRVSTAEELKRLAETLERGWSEDTAEVSGGGTDRQTLRADLQDAEEVLRTYLEIAEAARDEALLQAAQTRAEVALARVSLLSARLQHRP